MRLTKPHDEGEVTLLATSRRIKLWIATGVALSLAVPALAQAAPAKPGVTTGGVAKVTLASASLLGKVDPNGAVTSYRFQIGPTTLYGGLTAPASAGAGASPVNVVADVAGLAPDTKYHYRLVASNAKGTVMGADRAFKTKPQPLGLSLGATPSPVPFGAPTVLSGTLTGTGNAGRQVVLQSNPFPYTQGFHDAGNPQVIGATGAFAFPLLSVALNTQYRVLIPTKPEVVSPILSLGVAVKVGTTVSSTHVRRGQRVAFSGTVRPARDGARIAIQKLKGTNWVTVAGSITHHAAASFSRYVKHIRIAHGGTYRVFVAIVDGNYVSASGRAVKIRTR